MRRWIARSMALALAVIAAGPATAEPRMAIFDTHVHYSRAAWAGLTPTVVRGLLSDAGVTRALVSSTPDDGTLRLRDFDPSMFVPELRPYHGQVHSANWHNDKGIIAYLESRLAANTYKGIGEFHLYPGAEKLAPSLNKVVALAVARDIPLHVHAGAEPVRKLFELDPNLTVLWAHAGMSTLPDVIGPMMEAYPRLSAELSFRAEDITDAKGDIDPAWRSLLIRYKDRFMIGSDTFENERWASYSDLIESHRFWLRMLPPDVARTIAFDNAARMFGDGG